MKKFIAMIVCTVMLFSSCDTYTGSGAYMGGSIGSILGSAIGGLSGGPRGSDMGTIIGMAGGAAVGAIVGSQADQRQQHEYDQYQRDKAMRAERRAEQRSNSSYDMRGVASSQQGNMDHSDNVYPDPVNDSNIFDSTNSGDDRLYDFNGKDYLGDYSAQPSTQVMPSSKMEQLGSNWSYSPTLEIINARFVDANEDNTLNRNETCKVIFEIMNRGNHPVYDVVPTVVETTGNKHIFISPSIHVEKIAPGRGIRYTAMVKADNRLKSGMAHFCVSVIHEGKCISKVNEFNIPTRK